MLGADLTPVRSLVRGTDVLDDEAPLGRPLVVVHRHTRVLRELEQSDRQRVDFVLLAPRNLHTSSNGCTTSNLLYN